MPVSSLFFLVFLLPSSILALNIPDNVKSFYDSHKDGSCDDVLAKGFYDGPNSVDPNGKGNDGPNWSYCQDGVKGKAIFLKGPGTYANMDIDCDGNQAHTSATHCKGDNSDETAYHDTVASYGIKELDTTVHPYVVFGNDRSDGKPTFRPADYDVEPLSVVAVVCGSKLIYGILGDTNGDDDPKPLVGEGSLALAQACFGDNKGLDGDSGYDKSDVLYIAFTGKDAVPGKSGAAWAAGNYEEFEDSITDLGNKLIKRLT